MDPFKKSSRFRFGMDQNGFTIIEVLIAAGMVAILSLAIASMLSGVIGGQRRVEMKNSTITKHAQINSTLNSAVTCRNIFSMDSAFNVAKVTLPYTIPQTKTLDNLQVFTGSGTHTVIIKKNDPISPGIITQDINLVLERTSINVTPGVDFYEGDLRVDYAFTDPKQAKMQPNVFEVTLQVDNTTGDILSCAGGGGTALTASQICSNIFGGFYDSSATPNCQLLGGTTTMNAAGLSLSLLSTVSSPNISLTTSLNGNGTASSTGFTTMNANQFLTPSDRTLKENFEPLEVQSSDFEKIRTYSYNYKKDSEKPRHIGVIAQELQNIYPTLVKTGEDGLLSVNYSEMVPILIKSLQETNQRLKKVEAELRAQRQQKASAQ